MSISTQTVPQNSSQTVPLFSQLNSQE